MRERPMRPPVGPTENMHSEYGPDVARSVPLSGASETVPIDRLRGRRHCPVSAVRFLSLLPRRAVCFGAGCARSRIVSACPAEARRLAERAGAE